MTEKVSDADKAWVSAAANVIETRNEAHAALAAGGPGETVKLCLFASIVPNSQVKEYMDSMTHLHNALFKNFPEIVSSRPEKPN